MAYQRLPTNAKKNKEGEKVKALIEWVMDVQGALIDGQREKISDLRSKLFLAENHRERRKK